jgi:hypothetical protein
MEKRRLVVLLGDSLLMDSVDASLRNRPGLGVMRMYAAVDETIGQLRALGPDLIMVDLDTPHADFIVPFLREQPDTPMLGIDADSNRVVVLSSRHRPAFTGDDLVEMIQEQTASGADRGLLAGMTLDQFESFMAALGGFPQRG